MNLKFTIAKNASIKSCDSKSQLIGFRGIQSQKPWRKFLTEIIIQFSGILEEFKKKQKFCGKTIFWTRIFNCSFVFRSI